MSLGTDQYVWVCIVNFILQITMLLNLNATHSILREDLSLREKMYLDLKERTDREIAQLNRTKQDLELRLRSVLESHQGGIADLLAGEGDLQSSEPMLSTLTGAGLPNLTASEVVEALGKWEGMEDTIVLFKEQLEAENGRSHSHVTFCNILCNGTWTPFESLEKCVQKTVGPIPISHSAAYTMVES